MIGEIATVCRVKGCEPFTTRGEITSMQVDPDGTVTAVCLLGKRLETNTTVHAWFVLCRKGCDHALFRHGCGLAGSNVREQTATLDACGHAVTARCVCATARAAI